MASLLYGSGLRLTECLRLRVKDVDFGYGQILVRDGKGAKDRVTMLPRALIEPLKAHLEKVCALHRRDLGAGYGEVYLPYALERKYPRVQGMGLAVRFSFAQALRGSARRRHTPTPSR